MLFVDVLRPLPFPESAINRLIVKAIGFSPFVLDAKRNQEAWERRYLRARAGPARAGPRPPGAVAQTPDTSSPVPCSRRVGLRVEHRELAGEDQQAERDHDQLRRRR